MTLSNTLVTILINNYNYGRFLRQAIDSALNQTYRNIEVIVVDDGSTDESREIVQSFGDRIIPILKENGGQASAFNAGFAASRGEIICLLDSDDFFHPDKVERVIPYSQPGSMLYHRVQMLPGPGILPPEMKPRMDYYRYTQRYRFFHYPASPTSGLVIRRDLALRLLPMPTEHLRLCADECVVRGACLIGQVIGIPDVLATYRIHGENAYYGKRVPKSAEFINACDNFINDKLMEAGKAPVMDFYRSMFAIGAVPMNAAELSRLALSVFRHHANLVTLRFMLRTLLIAFQQAVSPISSGWTRQS